MHVKAILAHAQKVNLVVRRPTSYQQKRQNHGMKNPNYTSIPVRMSIFRVFSLIGKDHDIGMGSYVGCVLIPTAVIGSEIDLYGLVAENSVIVYKKLSAVLISETILWPFSNLPQ